jgi:hypothetical protein
MSEPPPKPTYDQFKEFYDKHPDLDNSEYYAEFPTGNKSTIRSWKNRAAYIAPPPVKGIPAPDNPEFDAMQLEYIKILMNQTNSKEAEFTGVDGKSKLLILKNRLRSQKEQKPPSRSSNSSILPNPKPIGQSNEKFGLDDYIVFDEVKNEIRMEFPLDTLMDPEKNKRLREKR